MQVLAVDATWTKEIVLGQEVLDYIKENNVKIVGLFASVQFLKCDTVKKQLADAGCEVKTTRAKRTDVEMQILGCDAYHDSYKEDIISVCDMLLYIGDGLFHPKAVLLSQAYKKNMKDLILWDPVNEDMTIIGKETIIKQLKKMKANIAKYLMSKTVGIMVTTKPGQQYFDNALKLKKKLEEQGKEAYIFLDSTFETTYYENYTFIDSWVNTACPRIGFDDNVNLPVSIINIREAWNPSVALEKLE